MIQRIQNSIITPRQSVIVGKIKKSLTPRQEVIAYESPVKKNRGLFGTIRSIYNKTVKFMTNNTEDKFEPVTNKNNFTDEIKLRLDVDSWQKMFAVPVKAERTKVQELQDTLLAAAKAHKEPLKKPFKNPFLIPEIHEVENLQRPSLGLQNALLNAAENFDFSEKTVKPSAIDIRIKEIGAKLQKMKQRQSVIDEVIDFTRKKLGHKTFEAQKTSFAQNATKMRLNFLPEIFSSIADTRKVDRQVGKFNSRSSNKDAFSLFMKINTNNKRLVNYLLKVRKEDDSRVYEVKDIISVLDNAEKAINKKKQLSKDFKSADVKAYYKEILEANIKQYGKIARKNTRKN